MTLHQAFQSGVQFLTILIAQLVTLTVANNGLLPDPKYWALPVLLAAGGALGIFANSKVVLPDAPSTPGGGANTTPPAQPKPTGLQPPFIPPAA